MHWLGGNSSGDVYGGIGMALHVKVLLMHLIIKIFAQ
jgi:hypothetical protein